MAGCYQLPKEALLKKRRVFTLQSEWSLLAIHTKAVGGPSPSPRAFSRHHRHAHQSELPALRWCMALCKAGVGNPVPRAMWRFLTMLDIFQLKQQGPLATTQGVMAWARGMGGPGDRASMFSNTDNKKPRQMKSTSPCSCLLRSVFPGSVGHLLTCTPRRALI